MLVLTFDTWEEFDKAIAQIVTLENFLANGVSPLTKSEDPASV